MKPLKLIPLILLLMLVGCEIPISTWDVREKVDEIEDGEFGECEWDGFDTICFIPQPYEVVIEVERIVEVPVEVEVIKEKEIIREVEVPVYVEVPVHGETVYVEVPGETQIVEVHTEVEVSTERIVEIVKVLTEQVEVPVEVVRIIEVPVETVVEVPVDVVREVPVEVIKEVIKEVEVPGETVVKEVEVIREVPVETVVEVPVEVIREVERIIEVPVETIVYRDVVREVEVIKEVIREVEVEVPGETITVVREVEVIREVEVPGPTVYIDNPVPFTGTVVISQEQVDTCNGDHIVMIDNGSVTSVVCEGTPVDPVDPIIPERTAIGFAFSQDADQENNPIFTIHWYLYDDYPNGVSYSLGDNNTITVDVVGISTDTRPYKEFRVLYSGDNLDEIDAWFGR